MAVQFNLLPDVKLEFNRAQKLKKTVYGLSALAAGIVIVVVILSFVIVNVLQKSVLDSANNDIKNYSQKLKGIPNLDKVLTIQNQLNSLPALHQKKHVISRLFNYLPKIVPSSVHIGKFNIDVTAGTMEIQGTAATVENVNQFVDTLKFTNFTTASNKTEQPAFSQVVLTQIDRNDKGASYTIDTNFDPALFDPQQNITLVVPNEITTRSVLNTPEALDITGGSQSNNPLFNGQTGNTKTNNQGSNNGQ